MSPRGRPAAAVLSTGVDADKIFLVDPAIVERERKLLLRPLRRRFGAEVDRETECRVAVASAEQVEIWAERVLSTATLAELLAD